VASARKWLGDGDVEASKAARTKAALEYDQAKEDRASELAVGIYVVDLEIPKAHAYVCMYSHILHHSHVALRLPFAQVRYWEPEGFVVYLKT
jgi:hypothetical protein